MNIYDLISNPVNYFVHKGVKFSTLDTVVKFKIRRCSTKDADDVVLVSNFLSNEDLFSFEVTSRKQINRARNDIKSLERRIKNLPIIRHVRRAMGKQVW